MESPAVQFNALIDESYRSSLEEKRKTMFAPIGLAVELSVPSRQSRAPAMTLSARAKKVNTADLTFWIVSSGAILASPCHPL